MFFCVCSKNPAADNPEISGSGGVPQAVYLSRDSVTVNGVQSDTLRPVFDTSLCAEVVSLKVYFSLDPKLRFQTLCGHAFFENLGNARYVCYECLTFEACTTTDLHDFLRIERWVDSVPVTLVDTIVQQGKDTVYDIVTDTVARDKALFHFTFLRKPDLGTDSGKGHIVLDSLLDPNVPDSGIFADTILLYWDDSALP